MKLMSARERRAPAPLSTEKRAPDIRVARSKSMMPSAGPRSQCACGLEVERPRIAVPAHLHVVRRARPHRHARVREVGQREQRLVPLVLDRVELHAELLDLLGARAVRLLDVRGVVPLPLGARHLVARRVLLALQPLELGDQPAPRGFERGDLLERAVGIEAAVAQAGADLFDVIADVNRVEHDPSASIVYSRPA